MRQGSSEVCHSAAGEQPQSPDHAPVTVGDNCLRERTRPRTLRKSHQSTKELAASRRAGTATVPSALLIKHQLCAHPAKKCFSLPSSWAQRLLNVSLENFAIDLRALRFLFLQCSEPQKACRHISSTDVSLKSEMYADVCMAIYVYPWLCYL